MKIDVSNIDWKLLRKQKTDLVNIVCSGKQVITDEELKSLEGILHLIDHVQDEVVDKGLVPEDEIFT